MSKFINLSLLAATAFTRFISALGKDRAAVDFPVTNTGRESFFKSIIQMVGNHRIITQAFVLGTLTVLLASCAGVMDMFSTSLNSAESVQRRIDSIARIMREDGYTESAGLDAIKVGKTFEEGEVVPKDLVLAHAWYKVAVKLFSITPTKCTVKWEGQCKPNDAWSSRSSRLEVAVRQQMTSEDVQRSNKLATKCIRSEYQSCPGIEM